jgi:tetratricopeptide (TPR) repeat protein
VRWAIVALFALSAIGGCGKKDEAGPAGSAAGTRSAQATPATNRLLLVGVDGAEWRMLRPLMEEGKLPNFERLVREGASGDLESLVIMLSPIIWTSIATGKTADKHGIGWFMADNPKTGKRIPIQSRHRKVKAIWNILGERGRVPGLIGWWATWPAEDVGRGFVVSDYLGFHGFGVTGRNPLIDRFLTFPESITDEARSLIPDPSTVTYEEVRRYVDIDEREFERSSSELEGEDAAKGYRNLVTHFLRYLATMKGYRDVALRMWTERSPEFLGVYFEQVDSTSHLFMKYAPPKQDYVSEESYEKYHRVVEEIYRRQDEILGDLLDAVGDDVNVIVVSDHGFKVEEERPRGIGDVDPLKAAEEHKRMGVIIARGPDIRRGVTVEGASVLDITPTLLCLLGEPVADDMDGRVLVDFLRPEFLRDHPIRTVPTFEGDESFDAEPLDLADGMAEAEEERLRALGYLDDDGNAEDFERLRELGYLADDASQSSAEVHNNLGNILLQQGDVDRAIEEFEQALRIDPGHPGTHAGLATAYVRKGRLADAEKHLDLARRLDPRHTGTLENLGQLQLALGNLEEAKEMLRQAVAAEDASASLLSLLGQVYAQEKDWSRAGEIFARASVTNPEDPVILYNLGVALEEQGELEEAARRFDQAIAIAPDFAAAHNNLGRIRSREGLIEEAIEEFEAAVRIRPDHVEAGYNLATCYLQVARDRIPYQIEACNRGLDQLAAQLDKERRKSSPSEEVISQIDEAMERYAEKIAELQEQSRSYLRQCVSILEQTVRERPGMAFAWHNLAIAHQTLLDHDRAREIFESLTRDFPDMPNPWYQSAVYRMKDGDREGAVERLRRALAIGGDRFVELARLEPAFAGIDPSELATDANRR